MVRVRVLFKLLYLVLFVCVLVFLVFMSQLPEYETKVSPVEHEARHSQRMLASEGFQDYHDVKVKVVHLKNDTANGLHVVSRKANNSNTPSPNSGTPTKTSGTPSPVVDTQIEDKSTVHVLENPIDCVNFDQSCLEGDDHHYKMVVGILSAKRSPPTVVKMVQELVRPINSTEDYKLLVWRSESTSNDVRTAMELSELGTSVVINHHPYPELDPNRVKITFDDSVSRVIWRTSHVLDYANLLELALRYDSEFIMVLEDDLKPAKFALDKSYQFAKKHFSSSTTYSKWGLLTMYSTMRRMDPIHQSSGFLCFCGACALIIKKEIIPDFIGYLHKDPYAAPVDMMMWKFLTKRKLFTYERTPNLFQHISSKSSYTAEDQKERKTETLRSVSFEFDEDNRSAIPGYDSKGGYVGCFKDSPEDRDFVGVFSLRYVSNGEKETQVSLELCEDFCNGYHYFALQNGDECYCGNEFGKYGAAPEEECDQICRGHATKPCGGTLRNSVYRTSSLLYYYVGCRVRKTEHSGTTSLSPDDPFPGKCKQLCKDQPYFAVYDGSKCVCLDSTDKLVKRRQNLCSKLCNGNPTFTCGGKTSNYMSVYQIGSL